jgi:hypothetical protein
MEVEILLSYNPLRGVKHGTSTWIEKRDGIDPTVQSDGL